MREVSVGPPLAGTDPAARVTTVYNMDMASIPTTAELCSMSPAERAAKHWDVTTVDWDELSSESQATILELNAQADADKATTP